MFIKKSTHDKAVSELTDEIKKLQAENKALAFKVQQYKKAYREK